MIRLLLLSAALSWISPVSADAQATQPAGEAANKIRALIIDGQNNHDWRRTTPLLRQILERSGRFLVDVATSPRPRQDMSGFRPRFADYHVVISNYNGERWPRETEQAFEAFVAGGGGFVTFHAANNAFPDWPEYNRICGLGGWGGRDEKSGPLVFIDDEGQVVRDESRGAAGHHGPQHAFQVRTRDAEHPIMKGLPALWMHTRDELYDSLRGPAEGIHVLATAYSAPDKQGTGRHEPVLMTIEYGRGRVFHTTLGHADYSIRCVGFATTFSRGAEWAATGKATMSVPDDFPTADQPSSND
jgi:type 1 glutamine amidotransferase